MVERRKVGSRAKVEILNVTSLLEEMVEGVPRALAVFYLPHTTASLIMCEDDEELREDIVRVAKNLFKAHGPFAHLKNDNPNAEAHIFSALGGTSLTLPVFDGALDLGKYQHILLLELDGPKEREIRCFLLHS
jgi:secondary thiamine-phosphate synthase enzyme